MFRSTHQYSFSGEKRVSVSVFDIKVFLFEL